MHTINYLAYGSNLLPARLAARVRIVAERGVVAIPDHALSFTKRGRDGSGKCTLVPCGGALAWCAVYAIAADDKPALDAIEGVGKGYAVHWRDCPPHGSCFLYLATADALVPDLPPYTWYQALVLAGARHHSLPADYLAAIAAVPAIADSDSARAAQHAALLM